VREKDGLWAVLFWLNLLAGRRQPVAHVLRDHWNTYGRDYYTRHDYEAIEADRGNEVMSGLHRSLPELAKLKCGENEIVRADDFAYRDPVDGSLAQNQGIRLQFKSGARIVYRLSGTGTEGATLRIYIENYEPDAARQDLETQAVLKPLIDLSRQLADVEALTGRRAPSVIT
jgi:phosphoglucomutase